ncbi:hypothetical protein HK098_001025 [Nowakowskiella sp. JEL0407]|nr:hypothetical protein HK098_001025 [Nowakowskiella sp. JEL0407]
MNSNFLPSELVTAVAANLSLGDAKRFSLTSRLCYNAVKLTEKQIRNAIQPFLILDSPSRSLLSSNLNSKAGERLIRNILLATDSKYPHGSLLDQSFLVQIWNLLEERLVYTALYLHAEYSSQGYKRPLIPIVAESIMKYSDTNRMLRKNYVPLVFCESIDDMNLLNSLQIIVSGRGDSLKWKNEGDSRTISVNPNGCESACNNQKN